MERKKKEQDGLPEIYLSPSHHFKHDKKDTYMSTDTDQNDWDDTDSETWIALVPETTVTEDLHLSQESCMEQHQGACSLGLREEIEGDSSQKSSAIGKRIMMDRNQSLYAVTLNASQAEQNNEETRDANSSISQLQENDNDKDNVMQGGGNIECSGQRGETPGSDCPPVAGTGAFSRMLRQPLKLDTNFPVNSNSELIFSPGGDEGFIVPGGVHAYYGSGSDTEDGEGGAQVLIPVRDAVEGADGSTVSVQTFLGNVMPSGLEDMERNSPAGLSTPDADTDLTASAGRSLISKKLKNNVRPPVMGQSEELLVQASRKDLGSTDGEESDDENQRRLPVKATSDFLSAPETQPGSLGSQSENTDSVNTVLDMSRGEIQGCETGDILDTPLLSPLLVAESFATHSCPKPAFVVGGLISPRGKFKQFQNTVRDRMQDMKASLELQPSLNSPVQVDRDQFLSQPSIYPPIASVSEQEVSLMSMISVESTNHPESSERVTSPSVLSVSSAASSRRMEWDSGADVGYSGNLAGSTHEHLVTSMSTLERIAIGNYASVLRTEPEGTTQVKEKQKVSKKSSKILGTKVGSSSVISRQTVVEGVTSSPSRLLRVHQTRDKMNFSSSDEEFGSRLSSPAQSPRRRPRRRVSQTNTKEMDSPQKRVSKRKQVPLRRLKEVMQELCNEGKSSSLIEIAMTSVNAPQYRRSSSQQSLSLPRGTFGNAGNAKSNISVVAGSASSITTAAHQKNMSEDNLAASSTANISISTSTLLQSVSPIPQAGVSASTSGTLVGETLHQQTKGKKDEHRSLIEDTKHSSQSSLQPYDRESQVSANGRTWISSGNISSKSHESSDIETPPDMKDTDGESCTSHHLSDDEPVNLKARKNSENAKNHENITKKCSKFAVVSAEQNKWKDNNDSNSCSSSLRLVGQRGSTQDAESVLESQVSLLSSNNALQALSVKLKERIQVLIDNGSLKMVQDYNKLQDYINFIGIPSANEEEYRLRQGVANVIMRMFGEIGLDDTDTSNTFNSETSEVLTTDSQMSDQQPQNMSEHTAANSEDLDVALPHDSKGTLEAADSSQFICTSDYGKTVTRGQECAVTSGSTICVVPYHPPSATRTYFMAVSRECDEGLVEGEHSPTPKFESPLVLAPDSELKISRGYAEGKREDRKVILSPTPPAHQLPDRDDDCNFEDPVIPEMESEPSKKSATAKDQREDDSESVSHATTLLHDWGISSRMGNIQGATPKVVTSEECSPRHAVRQSAWEWQSSWQEELGENLRDSVSWWSTTTRSERLYKDRRGTLHVANQPPGYMDDRDSHPSESMSDHEHHHHQNNDTASQEDVRRASARPWTSSGSESAYETIRERHRHVDEALASSFEFYSTSPWDTRLLGYVSSDGGRIQGPEEFEEQSQKGGFSGPLPLPPSPPLSEQLTPNSPARLRRHVSLQQQHQVLDRQNSSPSSQTDGNDVSSQVSFIQLQKKRYVRKIQRHIHTLEKLERALLVQLGDSIGSENSFRRCITEGRSHTDSDTNGRSQTRDILGQSETTSSIISSDYSDEMTQKRPYQFCRMGRVSKTKGIETQPDGQDSPFYTERKSESIQSTAGQSVVEQSHTSSPRVTLSQLSSDLTSSRASTLKQVEEEVRKLAFTEKRSRHVMKHSRLHPHVAMRGGLQSQDKIRKMHRKEPRGEEDPMKYRFASRRSISDNTLYSNTSVKSKISKDAAALDWKGTSNRNSDGQPSEAHVISEEEITSRAITNSQISRQGDGRETRDQTQISKVDPVTYEGDDDRTSALQSPPVTDRSVERRREQSRNQLFKDFGQMFPSSENLLIKGKGTSCMHLTGHSVGVQTSDSLLDLVRSSRESKGRSSSRPRSSITNDRKCEDVSSGSSRNKRTSSRSGSGIVNNREGDDHRQASGVSDRGDYINASEQGKIQSSRPDEKRYCKKQRDIVPINQQLDRKDKRSSKTDSEGKKKALVRDVSNILISKKKHERDRNGKNGDHRSVSPSRGYAKDEIRHIRDDEIVTLSRSSSRSTENREEVECRTVELFSPWSKRQEVEHIKESRTMTSSMPGSSRSERAQAVDLRTEPSSGSGSESEKKSFGNVRSGDSSMPESAINGNSLSGSRSETSSEVGSARNENMLINDCRNETSLNAVSGRKEFQYTGSVKNNPLIRQGTQDDNWQVLDQTGQDLLRTQLEREKDSLIVDQQNTEPSSQEYKRERAEESSNLCHTRASNFIIPPASQEKGAEEQIQLITKSISGSRMKFSRSKGLIEPPVGSSSALSEGSDTLRNSKNQCLYIYSNQISSDVSNTADDLKSDTKVLRPKNKTTIRTLGEEKTIVKQGIIRYKKPVRFDVSLDNKENLYQRQPQMTENYMTPETVVLMDKIKENLTLQEALARARPDYIQEASDRCALIRLKREMRQDAQNHNHQIVAQIPANLQTPSTLQRFLYKSDLAPLFSYKDIREQNRRLYQLLPEASIPGVKQNHSAQNRTNQLMARLYSQRLRKKVISGQVSHAHKEIVTPIMSRVQHRN